MWVSRMRNVTARGEGLLPAYPELLWQSGGLSLQSGGLGICAKFTNAKFVYCIQDRYLIIVYRLLFTGPGDHFANKCTFDCELLSPAFESCQRSMT